MNYGHVRISLVLICAGYLALALAIVKPVLLLWLGFHTCAALLYAGPLAILIGCGSLIFRGPNIRHRVAGFLLPLPVLLVASLVFCVGSRWGKPIVKYDNEAIATMESRIGFPGFSHSATDAFYWLEAPSDSRVFFSVHLRRGDILASATDLARHLWVATNQLTACRSGDSYIDAGPTNRPRRWNNTYWNVTNVVHGVAWEREGTFLCADLDSGWLYLCQWTW